VAITYEKLVKFMFRPENRPDARWRRWVIGRDRWEEIKRIEFIGGDKLVVSDVMLLGLGVDLVEGRDLRIEVLDPRPLHPPIPKGSMRERLTIAWRVIRRGNAEVIRAAIKVKNERGVPVLQTTWHVPTGGIDNA